MARDIFQNFKEHSITEFFKKNRQMLGFTGKIRSLTTIIHELVTNSLDACEEADILPEINVELTELDKEHYKVKISDNGPGIPKTHIGKALGMMLAGTKFHRYIQQRGQQGIGAAGCTMYSLLTTGKQITAVSGYKGKKIKYEIGMDFKSNKPTIEELEVEDSDFHGLIYEGEFKDVKYEKSNYGVFEYLRRTALANPHARITFRDPFGEQIVFPRAIESNPPKPHEIKPHPLGITAHDLLEIAHRQSENKRISSFLQNSFSRFSANKANELREMLPEISLDKNPAEMQWEEAEALAKKFKEMKWVSPETDAVIPIGKEQIEKSFQNIFNPDIIAVTERSPKIYRGGIAFVVEAGIAYGGGIKDAGKLGEIMRFANRVPLLFDTSGCAITESVKSVDWNRYSLKNFDEEPIVVLVNLVSVYVPYTSTGKQAIADEEEIMDEIKNAVMEAARSVQKYVSGKRRMHETENKRKLILRYVDQLSKDMADLAGLKSGEEIRKKLLKMIDEKYSSSKSGDEGDGNGAEDEKEEAEKTEEIGDDADE